MSFQPTKPLPIQPFQSPDENHATPLRVATVEVVTVDVCQLSEMQFQCRLQLRQTSDVLIGEGDTMLSAITAAVSLICRKPLQIISQRIRKFDSTYQCVVVVSEQTPVAKSSAIGASGATQGAGRALADREEFAWTQAIILAANHAGLLSRDYRANHQKELRNWASELANEISLLASDKVTPESSTIEAEGLILDYLNRAASAAVITAVNHPKPETILSLFDTSAWLYDRHGRHRDSYTDTDLWLAWYPGIDNDELTVDDVIRSMPAAPATAIPWIVKLFENPNSRLRFRGAIDLEDHDVMHVLLGRGLQDQDEAFVLGFAMGTAKKISRLEYHVFKFLMARVYPEPYRIPSFLQPAFDIGVRCGQQTGVKDLYKHGLKDWRGLKLGEARRRAGIDMTVLREHFQIEQQEIPFTIASLRLP